MINESVQMRLIHIVFLSDNAKHSITDNSDEIFRKKKFIFKSLCIYFNHYVQLFAKEKEKISSLSLGLSVSNWMMCAVTSFPQQ